MSLRETGSSSITKFGVSVTSRGSSTVRPSLNLVLKKMNKWNMGFTVRPSLDLALEKMNKWNMGFTVRPSLSSFLGRTSIIVAELEGGQ